MSERTIIEDDPIVFAVEVLYHFRGGDLPEEGPGALFVEETYGVALGGNGEDTYPEHFEHLRVGIIDGDDVSGWADPSEMACARIHDTVEDAKKCVRLEIQRDWSWHWNRQGVEHAGKLWGGEIEMEAEAETERARR